VTAFEVNYGKVTPGNLRCAKTVGTLVSMYVAPLLGCGGPFVASLLPFGCATPKAALGRDLPVGLCLPTVQDQRLAGKDRPVSSTVSIPNQPRTLKAQTGYSVPHPDRQTKRSTSAAGYSEFDPCIAVSITVTLYYLHHFPLGLC
jgi:hypothetical protein